MNCPALSYKQWFGIFRLSSLTTVKTGKNTEAIKPRIRYVCDIFNSFIYYTTLGGEDKSNRLILRETKWGKITK